MPKPQPTHSQYRRETRYFIRKYGRVAFFKATSIVNTEQSKHKVGSQKDTTSQTIEHTELQLVTVCDFSPADAQRFALLAPMQAQYTQQNELKFRSAHR